MVHSDLGSYYVTHRAKEMQTTHVSPLGLVGKWVLVVQACWRTNEIRLSEVLVTNMLAVAGTKVGWTNWSNQ